VGIFSQLLKIRPPPFLGCSLSSSPVGVFLSNYGMNIQSLFYKVGTLAATLFPHCERSCNASLYICGIVVDSSQALSLILATYCCYYNSNIRWMIVFSARLHSGLMNSHFCWTLASVSLTSPKCVILAITNFDSDFDSHILEMWIGTIVIVLNFIFQVAYIQQLLQL